MAQFAIGAVLTVGAAYLMGKLNPNVKGKLDDISISTSTYGVAIPRGWGTMRYNGNLIWCSQIKETKSENSGKGNTTKTIEYKYWASFAYAFCAGPADELLRLWADGKLIYDATGTGTVGKDFKSLNYTFYRGDEDQLPDWAMEADRGVGQVPAYRGLCYVACYVIDLNLFGGRLPAVSAEIAFKGINTPLGVAFTPASQIWIPDWSYNYTGIAIDWERFKAYRGLISLHGVFSAGNGGFSVVDLNTMEETVSMASDTIFGTTSAHEISALATASGSQNLYCQYGPFGIFGADEVFEFDKDGLNSTAGPVGSNNVTYASNVASLPSYRGGGQACVVVAGTSEFYVISSPYVGAVVLDEALTYVWGAQYLSYDTGTSTGVSLTDYLSPYYSESGGLTVNAVVPGAKGTDSGDFWYISSRSGSGLGDHLSIYRITLRSGALFGGFTLSGIFSSAGVSVHHVGDFGVGSFFAPPYGSTGIRLIRAEYDTANDALILITVSDAGYQGITSLRADGTFAWFYKTSGGVKGPASGQSRLTGSTFAWTGAPDPDIDDDTIFVIDTHTGKITRSTKGQPSISADWEAYDAQTGCIIQQSGSISEPTQMLRIFVGAAQGSPQALSKVVGDLCAQAGMDSSQYDVTELTDDVPGFMCQQETGRQSIEQLAATYIFDAVESDDVLRFHKRGRSPIATITFDDVKRGADDKTGTEFRPIIQPELETPRRVTVRWPDPARDYQTNTAHSTRTLAPGVVSTVASVSEQNIDIRVAFSQVDAKNLAKRGLLTAWNERESYQNILVGPKFLAVEPTDTVNLQTRYGDTVRVRLTKVEIGADWSVKLDGRAEDARLFSLTVAAADGGDFMTAAPLAASYTVRGFVGNQFPLLRDQDDTGSTALRSYTAAGTYNGDTSVWKGARLLVSSDDTTWSTLANDTGAVAYGFATNALGAPASPWVRDDVNTLTVRMIESADQLETVTYAQVMNGANPAALVNTRTGEAEILQYETVTPSGGGVYVLSGLFRGRRGSDWACGLHSIGDIFLVLNTATFVAITRPLSDRGVSKFVRAVAPFQSADTASSQKIIWTGAAEKPYSPVHIAGSRDGSNNLTITWVRRTRIGGEWMDGTEDAPLAEASETYSVDVLNVTEAVVRTISGLTSPTATYSAAEQISDGLTPGDPVHVKVYQLSSTVGRGYPGDATI